MFTLTWLRAHSCKCAKLHSAAQICIKQTRIVTITYRDEGDLYGWSIKWKDRGLGQRTSSEERKKRRNLYKKFKLISIMSYLGTQFKNYNLHFRLCSWMTLRLKTHNLLIQLVILYLDLWIFTQSDVVHLWIPQSAPVHAMMATKSFPFPCN